MVGAGKPRAVKAAASLDGVICLPTARAAVGFAAKYVALIRDPDNSRRRAAVAIRRRRIGSRLRAPSASLMVVILIDVRSTWRENAKSTRVDDKSMKAVVVVVMLPVPPAVVTAPPDAVTVFPPLAPCAVVPPAAEVPPTTLEVPPAPPAAAAMLVEKVRLIVVVVIPLAAVIVADIA